MDYCMGIAGFLEKGLTEYAQTANRVDIDKLEVLFGLDNNKSTQLYMNMPEKEIETAQNILSESVVKVYTFVVPNEFATAEWKEH